MSKKNTDNDIKKQSNTSKVQPKENIEINSNNDNIKNTTSIKEVIKESLNNIDEELKEISCSSTSSPIINEDNEKEHTETNPTENKETNSDDVMVSTDNIKIILQFLRIHLKLKPYFMMSLRVRL